MMTVLVVDSLNLPETVATYESVVSSNNNLPTRLPRQYRTRQVANISRAPLHQKEYTQA